jgi:hypothetical protein
MTKLYAKVLIREEKGKYPIEILDEPKNFCEKCFMQIIKDNPIKYHILKLWACYHSKIHHKTALTPRPTTRKMD